MRRAGVICHRRPPSEDANEGEKNHVLLLSEFCTRHSLCLSHSRWMSHFFPCRNDSFISRLMYNVRSSLPNGLLHQWLDSLLIFSPFSATRMRLSRTRISKIALDSSDDRRGHRFSRQAFARMAEGHITSGGGTSQMPKIMERSNFSPPHRSYFRNTFSDPSYRALKVSNY